MRNAKCGKVKLLLPKPNTDRNIPTGDSDQGTSLEKSKTDHENGEAEKAEVTRKKRRRTVRRDVQK